MTAEQTRCIRCDQKVSTEPGQNLTLTFDHEASAVCICEDCEPVVRNRDIW